MRTTHMIVIALFLVVSIVIPAASVEARGLSHRRSRGTARVTAADRGQERPSSTRRVIGTNRRALGAPVMVSPLARYHRAKQESVFKRGFRAVFKLDARGGSLPVAVGQHFSRGKDSEIARRRTAQTWHNVVGYGMNAGKAISRLNQGVSANYR